MQQRTNRCAVTSTSRLLACEASTSQLLARTTAWPLKNTSTVSAVPGASNARCTSIAASTISAVLRVLRECPCSRIDSLAQLGTRRCCRCSSRRCASCAPPRRQQPHRRRPPLARLLLARVSLWSSSCGAADGSTAGAGRRAQSWTRGGGGAGGGTLVRSARPLPAPRTPLRPPRPNLPRLYSSCCCCWHSWGSEKRVHV